MALLGKMVPTRQSQQLQQPPSGLLLERTPNIFESLVNQKNNSNNNNNNNGNKQQAPLPPPIPYSSPKPIRKLVQSQTNGCNETNHQYQSAKTFGIATTISQSTLSTSISQQILNDNNNKSGAYLQQQPQHRPLERTVATNSIGTVISDVNSYHRSYSPTSTSEAAITTTVATLSTIATTSHSFDNKRSSSQAPLGVYLATILPSSTTNTATMITGNATYLEDNCKQDSSLLMNTMNVSSSSTAASATCITSSSSSPSSISSLETSSALSSTSSSSSFPPTPPLRKRQVLQPPPALPLAMKFTTSCSTIATTRIASTSAIGDGGSSDFVVVDVSPTSNLCNLPLYSSSTITNTTMTNSDLIRGNDEMTIIQLSNQQQPKKQVMTAVTGDTTIISNTSSTIRNMTTTKSSSPPLCVSMESQIENRQDAYVDNNVDDRRISTTNISDEFVLVTSDGIDCGCHNQTEQLSSSTSSTSSFEHLNLLMTNRAEQPSSLRQQEPDPDYESCESCDDLAAPMCSNNNQSNKIDSTKKNSFSNKQKKKMKMMNAQVINDNGKIRNNNKHNYSRNNKVNYRRYARQISEEEITAAANCLFGPSESTSISNSSDLLGDCQNLISLFENSLLLNNNNDAITTNIELPNTTTTTNTTLNLNNNNDEDNNNNNNNEQTGIISQRRSSCRRRHSSSHSSDDEQYIINQNHQLSSSSSISSSSIVVTETMANNIITTTTSCVYATSVSSLLTATITPSTPIIITPSTSSSSSSSTTSYVNEICPNEDIDLDPTIVSAANYQHNLEDIVEVSTDDSSRSEDHDDDDDVPPHVASLLTTSRSREDIDSEEFLSSYDSIRDNNYLMSMSNNMRDRNALQSSGSNLSHFTDDDEDEVLVEEEVEEVGMVDDEVVNEEVMDDDAEHQVVNQRTEEIGMDIENSSQTQLLTIICPQTGENSRVITSLKGAKVSSTTSSPTTLTTNSSMIHRPLERVGVFSTTSSDTNTAQNNHNHLNINPLSLSTSGPVVLRNNRRNPAHQRRSNTVMIGKFILYCCEHIYIVNNRRSFN